MNDRIPPEEAAEALRDIAERQAQVIDLAAVPVWYWSVVGALMVVLALGVDRRTPLAVGIAVAVFVCGLLTSTGFVIRRVIGSAQLRNDLLGARGVITILVFVAAIDVPTVGAALILRAAHVHYPATIACAVGAIGLAIGGPLLMRSLHRTMLAGRIGS